MNKIYKKHLTTMGLIWAGCFALLLLAYMVILAPQNKSKSQTAKELSEKKQAYHAALKKASEETQAQLKTQIEELRKGLNGFVVGPEGSANLILGIGQLAGNKKLGSFKIGGQDKRRTGVDLANCNYIGEDHIDISFTAGFNQFATFLNALERYEPVVFVDNLLITRSDKGASGHQVDMNLSVFVRKQQES